MDTHSGKYGETTEGSVKDTLAFVDFIKEMKVFIKQTIDNIHILFFVRILSFNQLLFLVIYYLVLSHC